MPQIKANGLTLEYEIMGPEDGEVILLVMGNGGQLTLWPVAFCNKLVAKGYRVIRYDHRDVGLSQKMDEAGMPDIPEIIAAVSSGQSPRVAYTLDDMADDAVGLLDALGIKKAHIVGGSMGGMVAQLIAINHPERVLSLTSIMSTSANPELPQAAPEVIAQLSAPAPDPTTDRAGFIAHQIANARVTQSPAYPQTDEELAAQFSSDLDRCYHPPGFYRHYAAVLAAPDRRPKLKALKVPTLVIHGEDDVLMPVSGGRDTAANIPGAELQVIAGMGHDLAPGLFDTFVAGIDKVATRARA